MKAELIQVGIGEGKVAAKPNMLVSYALGSCVGICLYDSMSGLAGLVHVLLPSQSSSLERRNPYKFADSGIMCLIEDMVQAGASRSRLTAKIAGGARMFPENGASESVGVRNVRAVKAALARAGIRITAEDTGKNYGRTIYFNPATGELAIKTVKDTTKII